MYSSDRMRTVAIMKTDVTAAAS